jgi:peptidoglycan/LPS O-acetylase OafA/YrhL
MGEKDRERANADHDSNLSVAHIAPVYRGSLMPAAERDSTRTIPSLDGMRALSIILVVISHAGWYFGPRIMLSALFQDVIGDGVHGVAFFFVISGYLITTLLLREIRATGTISLKRFYFRRSMRIFPPFYVFMAVMGLFWAIHWIPEHWPSFLAAATYTWSLYPGAHGYYIHHTWSLSIEEQFYLLWPLSVLIFYRRQKLIAVSMLMILGMPVLRLVLYFVAPFLRGTEYFMIHGWADTIMVGCLLALLKGRPRWEAWHRVYINGWTATALFITAFIINPWISTILPRKPTGVWILAISPTIISLSVGGIMVYLVEHTDTIAAKILNNRVIRHIGVISYSLYLWQEIFTARQLPLLPWGFLYMFAAAELSFWIVERPSLRLRARLESTKQPSDPALSRVLVTQPGQITSY